MDTIDWIPLAPALAFGLSVMGNVICLAALLRSALILRGYRETLDRQSAAMEWMDAERREVKADQRGCDRRSERVGSEIDGPVGLAAWDGMALAPKE